MIYLKNLPNKKKVKTKALLENALANLIVQNELFHELFIAPNERAIAMVKATLKKPQQEGKALRTLDECKICLGETRDRYDDIFKLFKGKEKSD